MPPGGFWIFCCTLAGPSLDFIISVSLGWKLGFMSHQDPILLIESVFRPGETENPDGLWPSKTGSGHPWCNWTDLMTGNNQYLTVTAPGNLSGFIWSLWVVRTQVCQRLQLSLELQSPHTQSSCQCKSRFYLVNVCGHLCLDAEHYLASLSLTTDLLLLQKHCDHNTVKTNQYKWWFLAYFRTFLDCPDTDLGKISNCALVMGV